jgi:hypothetical protein
MGVHAVELTPDTLAPVLPEGEEEEDEDEEGDEKGNAQLASSSTLLLHLDLHYVHLQ